MQVGVGEIYTGKVTGITKFGAFVELSEGVTGMVHISEIASSYVKTVEEHLKDGQEVKVQVIGINENGKISLSIKKALEEEKKHKPPLTFEEMMHKFKINSEENISVLKKNTEGKRGSSRRK